MIVFISQPFLLYSSFARRFSLSPNPGPLCFVLLLPTLRELLSSQQHYDWGLRALKTVLQAAGTLLMCERKKGKATGKYICASFQKCFKYECFKRCTPFMSPKHCSLSHSYSPCPVYALSHTLCSGGRPGDLPGGAGPPTQHPLQTHLC